MIKRYLVKIKPIEPYTFGTERGSLFLGADKTGKESYIIESSLVPEQTTILGTLRYLVLAKKGLLKSNFSYTNDEQKQIETVIGKKSFCFFGEGEQSFGVIKSVSPVYITNEEEVFVKTPFCAKPQKEQEEQKYISYDIAEKKICTSYGMLSLPCSDSSSDEKGNYFNAKEGYGRGYISLDTKKIIQDDDIFDRKLITGNRADNKAVDKKDGFFKREVVSLKKEFSFAVEVEAEEDSFPNQTVAYMGRRQSTFIFTFEEMGEEDKHIEEKVQKAFVDTCSEWYYALSDLYVTKYEPEEFAIIRKKKIRNLETVIDSNDYIGKRKKSTQQISLIEAGSVFLKCPELGGKYKTIGYNYIVEIGRKNV